MARPTRLKLLGERPVALPDGDPDTRTVAEAFTNGGAPPPVTDAVLAEDILALLRQSNERMQGAVSQVTAVANHAVERAEGAEKMAHEVADRQTAVATVARVAAQKADAAIDVRRQLAGVTARQLSATLASLVTFLVDRAPAIMALIGGWLLWQDTLVDPSPMKLIGLALYGVCVVGPAAWLSYMRR